MSSPVWVDQDKVAQQLQGFFGAKRNELSAFGQTVNQTFEAYVFAAMINWYKQRDWDVKLISPKNSATGTVKLKFNTRGKPSNYTHALCRKGSTEVQIRHGLRVATRHHSASQSDRANIVVDVAVIENTDLSNFTTDDHLPNDKLITFGEAKHMSAFAELVANFIGLVHELKPDRLVHNSAPLLAALRRDPAPFLYVSGILYPTARGIRETIDARRLDVKIYDHSATDFFSVPLSVTMPKKVKKVRP